MYSTNWLSIQSLYDGNRAEARWTQDVEKKNIILRMKRRCNGSIKDFLQLYLLLHPAKAFTNYYIIILHFAGMKININKISIIPPSSAHVCLHIVESGHILIIKFFTHINCDGQKMMYLLACMSPLPCHYPDFRRNEYIKNFGCLMSQRRFREIWREEEKRR